VECSFSFPQKLVPPSSLLTKAVFFFFFPLVCCRPGCATDFAFTFPLTFSPLSRHNALGLLSSRKRCLFMNHFIPLFLGRPLALSLSGWFRPKPPPFSSNAKLEVPQILFSEKTPFFSLPLFAVDSSFFSSLLHLPWDLFWYWEGLHFSSFSAMKSRR